MSLFRISSTCANVQALAVVSSQGSAAAAWVGVGGCWEAARGKKGPLVEVKWVSVCGGHRGCFFFLSFFLRPLTSQHTERRLRFIPARRCRDFLETLTTVDQEKGETGYQVAAQGTVLLSPGLHFTRELD